MIEQPMGYCIQNTATGEWLDNEVGPGWTPRHGDAICFMDLGSANRVNRTVGGLVVPSPHRYQTTVQALRVQPHLARGIASWCGGWATADLRWSDAMCCYRYPDDHEYEGAMMPSIKGPVDGGVMLPYGVPAHPGDWIVRERTGHFTVLSDERFRAVYS